jgi:hypothetical protein
MEIAREDMDIAAYRHLVEVAAHEALSCRALSAAMLQLTGSARYHDIGQFLYRRAACAIEKAVGLLAQYDAAERMYDGLDRGGRKRIGDMDRRDRRRVRGTDPEGLPGEAAGAGIKVAQARGCGIPEPTVVPWRVAAPECERPTHVERVDGLSFEVVWTWQKGVFDLEHYGARLHVILWTERSSV